MNQSNKTPGVLALIAAVSVSGPSQAEPAAPAQAAEAARRGTVLEEVTVTARRKEERLQDVPIAVTALGEKDLADLRVESIVDVAQTVPNVYIQQQGGSLAPQINIRGISTGSLNVQVDSGISVYVDGVYLGRLGAANFAVADLARVEVLRGPQGTLFGKNSTGGAINMITAVPTGNFGVDAEIGFGSYGEKRYKARLDLPSWNGLAARFSFVHHENDGWLKNSGPFLNWVFSAPFGTKSTNGGSPAEDENTLLAALRYTGIDGLTVDYKYDRSKGSPTMAYRQVMNLDPQSPPAGFTRIAAPIGFDYQNSLPEPMETGIDRKVEGHSLAVAYGFSDAISAKYIGSYRDYTLEYGGNQVYGSAIWTNGTSYWTPLFALRNETQHQRTHELQLLGRAGPVDWIVGYFDFEESARNNNPVILAGLTGPKTPGVLYTINPDLDYYVGQNVGAVNKSKAPYGQLTWHVTDALDATAGIRDTKDDRVEHVFNAGRLAFGSFVISPGNGGKSFKVSGSHTDSTASLTYKFRPGANVYAKYSSGYLSGGTLGGVSFEPETVKSYEVGLKADLLGNRLRTNLAIFDMERKSLQIEGFTATGYLMQNVGKAKSKGAELEVTYVPVEGLTLNGTWGYTKDEYSGTIRPFQPKNTLSGSMTYDLAPLSNGWKPSLRIDASWRDDANRLRCPAGLSQVALGCGTTGEIAVPALDKAAILKAQTRLAMRFSLGEIKLGAASGRVSIWGRNLLDNREPEFLYTLGGTSITGIFQEPRTVGVDLGLDF